MRRFSPSSFVVGIVAASAMVALPAVAAVTTPAPAKPRAVVGFDGTSPSLTLTPLRFVPGTVIEATSGLPGCENYPRNAHGRVPLELKWSGADSGSGLAAYDVYANWGEERPEVLNTQQTSLSILGRDIFSPCGGGDAAFTYRVVAKDKAGNSASSASTAANMAYVWQEDGTSLWWDSLGVAKTGNWGVSQCSCSDGQKTWFSTTPGSSVTYSLPAVQDGADVAVVMGKNKNRAPVGVSVDGGPVVRVDTYSPTAKNRVVVWRAALKAGTHTVRLTNLGKPGTARSRVDIDAVMLTVGRVQE